MSRIAISEARADLGRVVDRVSYTGEAVCLSKNGKDVAALVSMEAYRLLRKLEDEVDIREAAAALAESASRGTVAWKKIKAELGL